MIYAFFYFTTDIFSNINLSPKSRFRKKLYNKKLYTLNLFLICIIGIVVRMYTLLQLSTTYLPICRGVYTGVSVIDIIINSMQYLGNMIKTVQPKPQTFLISLLNVMAFVIVVFTLLYRTYRKDKLFYICIGVFSFIISLTLAFCEYDTIVKLIAGAIFGVMMNFCLVTALKFFINYIEKARGTLIRYTEKRE